MIENYKTNLLEYLTGNVVEETKSTTPYYLDTTNELNDNLYDFIKEEFDYSFWVNGSVQCKDGKGQLNGKILFWGEGFHNENETNSSAFLLLVDENLNPISIMTTYESGYPLFHISTLEVAEDGNIYGIDYSGTQEDNDIRFRIVLFNNMSEIPKGYSTYTCILRNSYYIQGLTSQETQYTIRKPIIKKSPQSATYYWAVCIEEIGAEYAAGTFKINVGASNEWTRYPNIIFSEYSVTWNQVFFGKDDIPHAIFYENVGFDDESAIWKYTYIGNSAGENEKILENVKSYFSSTATDYTLELIPTATGYYLFLAGTDEYTTGNYRQMVKIYLVENNPVLLYEKHSDSSTTESYTINWITFNYSLVKDNLLMYIYLQKDLTNLDSPNEVWFLMANKKGDIDASIDTGVETDESVFASFDNIFTVNNVFNLYNSILYLYGSNGYTLVNTKLIYNSQNYNGLAYKDTNLLIGNQGIIYDTNNKPIFARNLYNYKVYNNRVNSTLNVPNNTLNDTVMSSNVLLGKTNKDIIEDNESITKNIYEDLYINYFITLNMENQNEDIYITNKAGSINLTQSAFKNGDYENAKATKMKITYDDDSTLMTSTSATINNGIATYDISVYIPSDKNIDHIDIMSEDENIVYQTITNETISKLNLQNNKYYHITQDVHVE